MNSHRSAPMRIGLGKCLIVAVHLYLAATLMAADFYVATTGSDSNAGTLAAPFLTLAKARNVVRAALPTATEGINVWVRGGSYYLAQPLEFGIADSGSATVPVLYSGYLGETVEISGAATLSPTWGVYSGSIMMADIGSGLSFDVLFANGTQQVLARYPNYNANTVILNGYANNAAITARATAWANPTTGFVRALHSGHWGGQSYKITGVSGSGARTLEWVGDNNRGSAMDNGIQMVENLFEELDAPGEWFYNATTGRLYFYPPAGLPLSSATIQVATSEELIRIVGTAGTKVKFLQFDRFTYAKTARTLFTSTYEKLLRSDWAVARKGAVFLQDAENITFSNSTFNHLGGNAIFISGYNRNHVITRNEFSEIGATCVNMVGLLSAVRYPSSWSNHLTDIQDTTPGPLTDDYPKDITVSYNHMENMGRFEKQTCGVNLSMSESITVSHNTVHGSPRAGLNVCDGTWGGHLFEFNDVFDCVRETNDHGPFNAWGRDRFWSYLGYNTTGSNGTAKKPYAFLDAWKTTIIRNNRIHYSSPTAFGIDLDDGSTNYEVYNNLILNSSIKLREGFGRKVYNNIMVNRGADLHVWYAGCEDQVTNNITISGNAYNLAQINAGNMAAKQATINFNLFYNAGNAVSIGFNGWSGAGMDLDSVTANPLFNNPATLDYSVAAISPALGLGFVNFPMNQFGKPGAPVPPPISAEVGQGSTSDAEPLMGASAASIYDIAIQSATGAPDTYGVYFETVPADSHAARQGFLTGDVIRSFNGTPITTKQSFWLLYHEWEPGTSVPVTILRNQTEQPFVFKKIPFAEALNDTAGVDFTGTWESAPDANAFNGDLRLTSTSGDFFQLSFHGTGVAFTSRKDSSMGNIGIHIDGVLVQTVNCYNATRLNQRTVFSTSGLAPGNHTLKVVNAEAKTMTLDSITVAGSTNVTTSKSSTAPTVSTTDLAQLYYLGSAGTGGSDVTTEHAQLFNGQIGNQDADTADPGEVTMTEGSTVTVSFDTSVNSLGYDITGIDSNFGWSTTAGGRSNQGYKVVVTKIDDSTQTLAGPFPWEPNSPASYWTKVSLSPSNEETLASGVKAVTFEITSGANAGGVVVAREIDIFGEPTEISTLVAHWELNETEGAVARDASRNGLDAIVANATWETGMLGGALNFNGTTSSVTLPAQAFAGINNQITVSLWVHGDSSQPKEDVLLSALNAAGNRVLNIHLPWGNSRIYWDAGRSGTSSVDRISNPATATEFKGRWNHWVFTKNADTGDQKIYRNGALWFGNTGKVGTMEGITSAALGSEAGGAMSYDGIIDDVRIYSVELSATEVSNLFAEAIPTFTAWRQLFPSTFPSPDDNSIEGLLGYVFNGQPTVDAPPVLPTFDASGDHCIFSFTRRVDSGNDTFQVFQYSTDFANWTDINISAPTGEEVTLGPVSDGLQEVTVTLGRSAMANERLFGRLNVRRTQ